MYSRIAGTGSYLPEKVVTNADLEKIVDTTDEWIRSRTGIESRHMSAPEETTSSMATIAARRAMEMAGVGPEDIDFIIVGTTTPDVIFPNVATIVQAALGIHDTPALAVETACAGFMSALSIADKYIRLGEAKCALVIGAETLSRIVDWTDRTTCVLFGDGAGAVVLETTPTPHVGILGNLLGADGNNAELLHCVAGGSAAPATPDSISAGKHFLRMNGKEVFRHAVRVMAESCERVLAQCNVTSDQVAWFIPHQANIRILEAVASQLNVGMERFPFNLDRYGNTSAASIPLALEEAWREGKIKHGDLVLIVAFGSGLTWGATLLRWHEPSR